MLEGRGGAETATAELMIASAAWAAGAAQTENCFDNLFLRHLASGDGAAFPEAISKRRRCKYAHDAAGSVSH